MDEYVRNERRCLSARQWDRDVMAGAEQSGAERSSRPSRAPRPAPRRPASPRRGRTMCPLPARQQRQAWLGEPQPLSTFTGQRQRGELGENFLSPDMDTSIRAESLSEMALGCLGLAHSRPASRSLGGTFLARSRCYRQHPAVQSIYRPFHPSFHSLLFAAYHLPSFTLPSTSHLLSPSLSSTYLPFDIFVPLRRISMGNLLEIHRRIPQTLKNRRNFVSFF